MSLNDYKFTESDFINQGISDLPDRPSQAGISAAQLKARFDNIPKIIIALGRINSLLDHLQSGAAGADIGILDGGTASKLQNYVDSLLSTVGAGKIGMEALHDNDLTGSTVKEKLLYLANMVRGVVRFTPRGIINSSSLLPADGNDYGDFFYVRTADPNTFENHVWVSDPDHWEYFGNVSQYTIDEINDQIRKISNGITQSPAIGLGMNSVIRKNDGVTAIPKFTFQGKSYVNLLGRDGDCEDVSRWTGRNATLSLDSTKKVYGANAIKITLTSTGGDCGRALSSFNLDVTKYYLISAFVANGNATYVRLNKTSDGGGVFRSTSQVTSTSMTRVGLVVQPSDLNSGNLVTTQVIGESGQYAYVDGIMVNEITADEYNNHSVAQLLDDYPYIDSHACVENPYIEIRHGNLARNGNCEKGIAFWKLQNEFASISVENNKFKQTNTGASAQIRQIVPVKANTDYYLSAILEAGSVAMNMAVYDESVTTNIRTGVGTFNSGNRTSISVVIWIGIGYAYFSRVHIIEGTAAPSEYKPCRIKRTVFEGKLLKGDHFTYENGEITGLLNWDYLPPLYGRNYAWEYWSNGTGYKAIRLNFSLIGLVDPYYLIKYDGRPLPIGNTAADQHMIAGNPPYYYVNVANSDSGWVDAVPPNADEAKAFMNGWWARYNESNRYTVWVSRVDNSVPAGAIKATVSATTSTTAVTVSSGGTQFVSGDRIAIMATTGSPRTIATVTGTPTATNIPVTSSISVISGDTVVKRDVAGSSTALLDWCLSNIAPGYEGYRFHYKRRNPVPITDASVQVRGSIPVLNNGDNYVYVDSGMVLGEVANPLKAGDPYYIGVRNPISPAYGSRLRYRQNAAPFTVYKNGIHDSKWSASNDGIYTPVMALLSPENYDINATYTVDYQILKTMHIPPAAITIQYQQDILNAVADLAESVGSRQKADSALDSLVGANVYERVIFNSSIPIGWVITDTIMYLGFPIGCQSKKCKPAVKINKAEIVKGAPSGGLNVTNLFKFHSLEIYGSMAIVYLTTADATTIADIKMYGAFARNLDIELDCREVI